MSQTSQPIPEKTFILEDDKGNQRMTLIAQLWVLKNQNYITSMTHAVVAPQDFTDDDCDWLAEKFKEVVRMAHNVRS